MQNGEPSMYIGLSTMRNGLTQIQWSRLQLFFMFNAIALPFVFAAGKNGNAISFANVEITKLLLSVVGVVIHVGFYFGALRAIRWIRYLSEKLADFERLDRKSEPSRTRVKVFSYSRFKELRRGQFVTFGHLWPFGIGMAFWLEQSVYRLLPYLQN